MEELLKSGGASENKSRRSSIVACALNYLIPAKYFRVDAAAVQ